MTINTSEDISQMVEEAVANGDASGCAEIRKLDESGFSDGMCYILIANATGDYSVCSNIFWAHRPELYYSCYTLGALKLDDESYCKKIEALVEAHNLTSNYYNGNLNPSECFTELAIQRNDNSTCDFIEGFYDDSGNDKDNCYNLVAEFGGKS